MKPSASPGVLRSLGLALGSIAAAWLAMRGLGALARRGLISRATEEFASFAAIDALTIAAVLLLLMWIGGLGASYLLRAAGWLAAALVAHAASRYGGGLLVEVGPELLLEPELPILLLTVALAGAVVVLVRGARTDERRLASVRTGLLVAAACAAAIATAAAWLVLGIGRGIGGP